MALTITPVVRDDSAGNRKLTVTDITTDANYTAGGFTVTPANLGLNRVFFATCNIKTAAAGSTAVDVFYDEVASKLKFNAAAAEMANSLGSGTVVRVVAWGY